MFSLFLGISILFCINVSIVTSSCSNPTQPLGTLAETHPLATYASGKYSLFACDMGVSGAFGNVLLKCLENGQWSDPDRGCSDDVKFDMGSVVGISVCGFAGLMVLFVIFASRMVSPNQSKAYEETSGENADKAGTTSTAQA